MQPGGGPKNPPWARNNVPNNMSGMNAQMMDNSMMGPPGMMPFQQSQPVFNSGMMQPQGGMAMQMAGQMSQGQMYNVGNVVAYPTPRALNQSIYQNSQNSQIQSSNEQRVFTGVVTKTQMDFGFIDHEVFYQTSVCSKGMIPKVNDRVLVEATCTPNMPFKWNATRVQVLPKNQHQHQPIHKPNPPRSNNQPKSNTYNAVPPPLNKKPMNMRREERPPRREERKRSRSKSKSKSRERREVPRKRDSPPPKRSMPRAPTPPRYVVRMPRMPLEVDRLDVAGVSHRYTNLYIPSDFFNAQVKWFNIFQPQTPFTLNNPCSYHIMNKDAEPPVKNTAVLEPPDADYRYSAKVMLITLPTLESLYQKCGITKPDEKDKRKGYLHPTRLIKFLVGQKEKSAESYAIGGPWSPSLDGENPETNPAVLVKTAIRTCKALTGIDLSACSQWYRMVEFYYWREGNNKSRLESVVLFLPDVWSVQPARADWPAVKESYAQACDAAVRRLRPKPEEEPAEATQIEKNVTNDESVTNDTINLDEDDDEEDEVIPEPTHYSNIDLKTIKVEQLRHELLARKSSCKGLRAQLVSRLSKLLKAEKEKEGKNDSVELDDSTTAEETVENAEEKEEKPKVDGEKEIKKEEEKLETEEEKKKLEKGTQVIKSNYSLPSDPHIIVHPSPTAKNGKFTCTISSLSLLLDYRVTDNKEHSFELFVFAELFNEMLMRDFGFYIYKTLHALPDKIEEVKEEKDKTSDKAENKDKGSDKKDDKDESADNKDEKKEEKDKASEKKEDKDNSCEKKDENDKSAEKKVEKDKVPDKKEEKDKSSDRKHEKGKKDDKREFKKRERKDSHSDNSRSGSPVSKRRPKSGVDLPVDPFLLLALSYFDTTRCGHITKKDLQNLIMSLGLQLTRNQIAGLLERVCIKDIFSYKSLIQSIKDMTKGATDPQQDLPLFVPPSTENAMSQMEAELARGNRELLQPRASRRCRTTSESGTAPPDVSDIGMVMYRGCVVDVGQLCASGARAGERAARLEAAVSSARAALRDARAEAASRAAAERTAKEALSGHTSQMAAAKARIASLNASSKIFHSALKSIQDKVQAVINIKFEDDENVNKDIKQEIKNNIKEKKEVEVIIPNNGETSAEMELSDDKTTNETDKSDSSSSTENIGVHENATKANPKEVHEENNDELLGDHEAMDITDIDDNA